jgi:uncharacterized protein (TIGR03435 family)
MRMVSIPGAAVLAAVMFSQAADSVPAFEVATVRPSGPQDNIIGLFTYPGGRITAGNYTLKMLIGEAFDLQAFQISGGPGWTDIDRWSLEAKPPASAKSSKANPSNPKLPMNDEQRLMLQALLADRFQLKFHRTAKEGTVYLLLKGGKEFQPRPAKNAGDYPWVGGPHGGGVMGDGIAGTNATMELMAQRLTGYMGRPVLDRTGMTGAFDFRFEYPQDDPRPDVIGSILASVRGLGLKLESGKGPVETLAIDHAAKPEVR